MQKIDRLVWAEGTCFESYGIKIGIRARRAGVLDRLSASLPPCWKAIEPPRKLDILYSWLVGGESLPNIRNFDIMYSGAGRIARTMKPAELLEAFERDLRMNLALLSRRFIFIHAGVVGWRGHALIMPGRSFTGKSTLVEALVRAGAEYFSDEYAVLDKDGRVHAYSKPISIRKPETFIQESVAVKDIGGRIAERPMKVRTILVTRYRKGAKSRFREASPGQGTLDLVANAVAARFAPQRVVRIAGKTSVGAIVLRGSRGEARETAEQLMAILEGT
jgi:hypothetical protein